MKVSIDQVGRLECRGLSASPKQCQLTSHAFLNVQFRTTQLTPPTSSESGQMSGGTQSHLPR